MGSQSVLSFYRGGRFERISKQSEITLIVQDETHIYTNPILTQKQEVENSLEEVLDTLHPRYPKGNILNNHSLLSKPEMDIVWLLFHITVNTMRSQGSKSSAVVSNLLSI